MALLSPRPTIFREVELPRLIEIIESVVEFYFDGAEEIGSSDISIAVRSVFRDLDRDIEEALDIDRDMIRTAVLNEIARQGN